MSKGFNNIGNTCYLNSGLQMLIQNKAFCKKIFDNRNTSENLRKMTDFIIEYYTTDNKKSLTPNQIKSIVEKIKPMFRGNRQHDSEEFIISLIEILNDDIVLNIIKLQNKILIDKATNKNPNNNVIKLFEEKIQCIYLDYQNKKITIETLLLAIKNIQRQFVVNENVLKVLPNINDTSLKNIFEFEIQKQLRCENPSCLNERFINSKEILLTLPINDNSQNLDDCYNDFKTSETLEIDCEKCNKKQNTSSKLKIKSWGQNLIICLNRFKNNKENSSKINKDITIPFKWRHNYEIRGGVIHSGGISGGHYIYVGRNNDKWTIYNDSITTDITDEKAQNFLNKAYILFYIF
jgi:ubiquitin C-terminal hydrolase